MAGKLRKAAAVAAVLTLSLAACGGGDEGEEATATEGSATPEETVMTFLEAIGNGDGETACSLVESGAEFPFLVALGVSYEGDCVAEIDAFGDAHSENIASTIDRSAFDVVEEGEGQATVTGVDLDTAGRTVALDFGLEESEGGWKIIEVAKASG
jgi:hypothetical protein